MSEKSRSIEEKRLEQALFDQTKRVRQDSQSGKTIKAATALARAITSAATAGPSASKQTPQAGKLAQALALQKALLPSLLKKGRGQYKANLKAPSKPSSGNHQKNAKAGQAAKTKGKSAEPTSRPKMHSGGVSFHFKHTFVSKTMAGTRDPNAKESGTASAHQRYLERTGAPERAETTDRSQATALAAGRNSPDLSGSGSNDLGTGEGGGPSETRGQGETLQVGNIGSTFQERYDFWERVERNERQGIERGGRVQCRIVLELPHELSAEERLQILQDFAKIFEEKKLPHYGVIHRPDDNNDSRNYHAHFAYYDRPAKKLQNGTWDFEDPDTRQNKDRESRGAHWIRDLRHRYSEIANHVLEKAGVEKRYDARSFKDGGVEKLPEKHLGPKLSAMERQGYASTEGMHNGKVDADHRLAQIIGRSQKSRHLVMQRIAPVRAVLDLAKDVNDEMVAAEAKDLCQLTSAYLLNERFLIGHTRRKALHQARKRIELARPYQTSKWAERELETINAAIEKKGFDPKTKKRRACVYSRKKQADEILNEIDQRYGTEWVKLEALDRKAEVIKLENAQILSKMDTSRSALSVWVNSAEIRRGIARISKQTPLATDNKSALPAPPPNATKARSQSQGQQSRVRIRAILPGLEAALAKGTDDDTALGYQNIPGETAGSSDQAANTVNTPEHLSENKSHISPADSIPPADSEKKLLIHLTRRPKITLK